MLDIGANLTDPMFVGKYSGTQKHPSDLDLVLDRAWTKGLEKIIITVGTVKDVEDAVKLANKDGKCKNVFLLHHVIDTFFTDRLYITMGCHPTRCKEFKADPTGYYDKLCQNIEQNRTKIVAIGECGLDYDRLKFCDAETQRIYFEKQLDLVDKYKLPLFLHCRNSFKDFFEIIQRNADKIKLTGGVVHSFDGSLEEAKKYIDFGFYIGLNGCSLKTDEQLKVVAEIPLDKILLETDCPWCGVRPSHAGVFKHFMFYSFNNKNCFYLKVPI